MDEASAKERSFLKKLIARLKEFLDDIKQRMKLYAGTDKTVRAAVETPVEQLDYIADMFMQALTEAGKTKNPTEGDGGVKEALKMSENRVFQKYTEKQLFNWANSKRIVVYENDSMYMEFVNRSINENQYDKKLYFGTIPADYAKIIEDKTGINVSGFNCSLSSNEIKKIIKSHGNSEKEENRGQRAFAPDDFLNIPKVILQADSIKLSDKTYNGKPVIEFSKRGQEKYNVTAVVSDKHMDLFVQTAFINIKKGNLAMPTGEQAPIHTPEANNGTVSNNIIFDNGNDVKTKFSRQRLGDAWEDIRTKMYENQVHEDIINEVEKHIRKLRKVKIKTKKPCTLCTRYF